MKEPIFEHGGESEAKCRKTFSGTATGYFHFLIDDWATEVRIFAGIHDGQAVNAARIAYRWARELERRQLAAAPKINHEKFLERLDRELHEGRFEEDYPGQHPLSRRTA